jgi:hypothetical protein
LNEKSGAVTGRFGQIPGRASVDATVFSAELLENEQTVEFARLHLDVEIIGDGPPIFGPADFNGQIAGRDGTSHLRTSTVLNLDGETKRLNHRRTWNHKKMIMNLV